MGVLQDRMGEATAAKAKAAAESRERQARENRELVTEMARGVFGEATGEMAQPRRPRYKGAPDEKVYAWPEGMEWNLDPRNSRRIRVDGITFEYTYGRNAGPGLYPVLTCPDCGEENLGSQVDRRHNGDGPSQEALAQLAEEVAAGRQKYGGHSCYESGTAAVLSAARLASSRAQGITTLELLQRAAQKVGFGDY